MMKKNLRIGLDFDGVISDCGKLKSDVAKIIYGKEIAPHLFKRELIVGQNLLTEEEYNNLQNLIYGTREYGFKMEPVSDMLTYMSALINQGHEVKVITSRNKDWVNIAQEWLEEKGIKIEFIGVGTGVSKYDAAQGLDVYIDDDLEKLEPLIGSVPHLFLFSWGYNSHIQEDISKVKRIQSWNEFFQEITNIYKAI